MTNETFSINLYDLLERILHKARWNFDESERYSHSINTATRWRRGCAQMALAELILATSHASPHICAYYCGRGARITSESLPLSGADRSFFQGQIDRLKHTFNLDRRVRYGDS